MEIEIIDVDKAHEIIRCMIRLLVESDSNGIEWITGLNRLLQITHPEDLSYLVHSLYGGGGSFQDLVLYRDDKLLIEYTDQLHILQHELYQIWWSGRSFGALDSPNSNDQNKHGHWVSMLESAINFFK